MTRLLIIAGLVLALSACSERAAEKAEDTQQQAATTGTESLSLITQENILAHLEYLASDESLLLVFAASRKVAAESVGQAIAVLQVTGS